MTARVDLTALSFTQLMRIGQVAGLVKRREAGNLASRVASAMLRAVDAEHTRRIARAAPRLMDVPLEVDQDAAPDDAARELQNAIATIGAIRDSVGTDDPAREPWNEVLVALAELRDARHAARHALIDLMYRRTVPDDAA